MILKILKDSQRFLKILGRFLGDFWEIFGRFLGDSWEIIATKSDRNEEVEGSSQARLQLRAAANRWRAEQATPGAPR